MSHVYVPWEQALTMNLKNGLYVVRVKRGHVLTHCDFGRRGALDWELLNPELGPLEPTETERRKQSPPRSIEPTDAAKKFLERYNKL